jgi:hypothetical protein
MVKNLFSICLFMLITLHAKTQADTSIKVLPIADTNKGIIVTAEANYLRHYLWRSISFGSDDVSQPNINFEYKGFYINLACNLNLIPKNLRKELYSKQVVFDEQDVEIGYSNTFKNVEYKARVMAYYYFNQPTSPSTKEFNISLEYPIYKGLSVFTEGVADIKAYKGALYNNTGIGYEFSKGKNDFEISTALGSGNNKFIESYFFVEKSGPFFWGNQITLTHNFKSFYCKFFAEYNFYLQKAIKEETGLNNTSNFSITLGKEFTIKLKK